MGYINRDKNAVLNMKKITEYLMRYKKRPHKYTANYNCPSPHLVEKKMEGNKGLKLTKRNKISKQKVKQKRDLVLMG